MKLKLVFLLLFIINHRPTLSKSSNSIYKKLHSNKNLDLVNNLTKGELCSRDCEHDEKKICYFNFMLKYYMTMSGACGNCSQGISEDCKSAKCITADGVQRGMLSLNFQLPGPPINVCKNDIVVVDLHNDAEGLATTLHFHGMLQKETPWMDGVPFLTQCPIPFGTSFRYIFYADDAGTHFYHAHAGHQKADGIFGPLIVREPKQSTKNLNSYDFDNPKHFILASDWMHQMADNHLPGMTKRSTLSQSILINGRGRFVQQNETAKTFDFTPFTTYHVQFGFKYRFRIINSALNVCPFQLQIENHNFSVISVEMSEIEPVDNIDTLHFLSGERYDIVISADKVVRDYWIRIRSLEPCLKKIEGFAILRYHEGKIEEESDMEFSEKPLPRFEDEYPKQKIFNSVNLNTEHVPVIQTRGYEFDKDLIESEPNFKFTLMLTTPDINNEVMFSQQNIQKFMFLTGDFNRSMSFVATINNITFKFPSFPLLVEPELIDESIFCNSESLKNSDMCMTFEDSQLCRCVHRLKVDLGAKVELLILNAYQKSAHPMHLHGNKFHILESGVFDDVSSVDSKINSNFELPQNFTPPYKDTAVLLYPGFLRLRFRATNPGFWFFHCHFDWHMPIGMALVIQVGETSSMKKPPKHFPRCHNFIPKKL